MSDDWLLLAVTHTVREEREEGEWVEIVRIISARQATRKERRRYEDENGKYTLDSLPMLTKTRRAQLKASRPGPTAKSIPATSLK